MPNQLLVAILCGVIPLVFAPAALAAGKARYFVVVVWDGMRPDFVSPELTPALHALRSEGVWFANHHSVYPTSTEVNGTVLATGVFPQRNGVTFNKEYRREIDPVKEFETQSLPAVRRGDALTGGRYVAVPTLAEMVQERGQTSAIVGAKPVALLHDRRARGDGSPGTVWFAGDCLPESGLSELTNRFGPWPAEALPNAARDEWARRCLTEAFWEKGMTRYSLLWLSEPDLSQHHFGPGSPQALEAIRHCDRQLAALLRELDRRGLREQTDVIVVSDHGFSTIKVHIDALAVLRQAGLNARTGWDQPPVEGDVVVVANGGSATCYVIGRSTSVIKKIVATLQHQPFTGVLFTRDGLPGTFPLAEAGIATGTAPDVVMAMRWTIASPEGAHPASQVFCDGYKQYASGMHVTLSPLDLHNLAVAGGPDFRRGVTNSLPSGNVDIVPTLLWLMGINPTVPLDGRVLSETLTVEAPPTGFAAANRRDASEKFSDGVWSQYLKYTELNGVRYLEEGNGSWTPASDGAAPPAKRP